MWFFPLFLHTLGPLMSWTQWTAAATVSLSRSPEELMRSSSLHHMATRSLQPPPRSPATTPQLKSAPAQEGPPESDGTFTVSILVERAMHLSLKGMFFSLTYKQVSDSAGYSPVFISLSTHDRVWRNC